MKFTHAKLIPLGLTARQFSMTENLPGWSPQDETYVIWLILDQYEVIVTHDGLLHMPTMNFIYSTLDDNIYLAYAKDQ